MNNWKEVFYYKFTGEIGNSAISNDIKSFITELFKSLEKEIEEKRPALFGGKSEIALIMKGYNQAIDDSLIIIKSKME